MTLIDDLQDATKRYEELKEKLKSEIKIGDTFDKDKENSLHISVGHDRGIDTLCINSNWDSYLKFRIEDWPKIRDTINELLAK